MNTESCEKQIKTVEGNTLLMGTVRGECPRLLIPDSKSTVTHKFSLPVVRIRNTSHTEVNELK